MTAASTQSASAPAAANEWRPAGREPRDLSWSTRAARRTLRWSVRAALLVYAGLLTALTRRRRAPGPLPAGGCDIVLTLTFYSENWANAFLRPLAAAAACRRLTVVSTVRVPDLPKVRAVYPPRWLARAAGDVGARLLTFVWLSLRERPHFVGGFHLLFNGLVAALIAPLSGSRSMYFSVGGPNEVLGGGVWGENRVFSRFDRPDAVVERRLLRAVSAFDLVFTMGTRAVDFFRARGLRNACHVLPGAIAADAFRPEPARRDLDLVLLARLTPVKRPDLFLRVVQAVAASRPDVRAAIVGDGPLRPGLEALAHELGIAANVRFAGYVRDVGEWLQRSRVFTLTSYSEGLALSLLEAMAAGAVPVVADVGDLRDVVRHGTNGFLIADDSPEAYARAIVPLLAAPGQRERLARAAVGTAREYDVDATLRRWARVFGAPGAPAPARAAAGVVPALPHGAAGPVEGDA